MILLLWSEAQQDEEIHLRLHTGWDSVGRATVLWSGWRLLFQWHDVQNVFFKSCRHRIFFTIFILKCNCTYGYHHKFHVSLSISHFSRMLPNLHCFLFFLSFFVFSPCFLSIVRRQRLANSLYVKTYLAKNQCACSAVNSKVTNKNV